LTGAGLLVDPENSAGLAKAIGCLLENPDSVWRMGEAARNRAMKKFNFQRHLDAYESVYQTTTMAWRRK
jgi:glycosyltransferase involved in cell wall biosynthesis